jgi:hypothetical protein
MVAFGMTEDDSATLLRDVLRRHPPPSTYFPHMFGCFVELLQLDEDSDEVENFAEQCGITVLRGVSKVVEPKSAA